MICYKNAGLLLLILCFSLLAVAQPKQDSALVKAKKGFWPFRVNSFDKQGRYHGRWKVYSPDNSILVRKGRFRHGKERGRWRYYYPDGGLMMEEYHRKNQDYFFVKRYHENGALAKEGKARIVDDGHIIKYYWFGNWKVYDAQGQFTHQEYYESGKQVELGRL